MNTGTSIERAGAASVLVSAPPLVSGSTGPESGGATSGRWDDAIAAFPHGPKSPKVQKTIAILLDAAEQAVTEHGIERFTTTDVARIAGLSIGAVYKYFTDRVALLDVIRPHRFDAETTLTELRHQLQQFSAKTRTHLNADQQQQVDAMIALTGTPTSSRPVR
jgi:hypothetical protein